MVPLLTGDTPPLTTDFQVENGQGFLAHPSGTGGPFNSISKMPLLCGGVSSDPSGVEKHDNDFENARTTPSQIHNPDDDTFHGSAMSRIPLSSDSYPQSKGMEEAATEIGQLQLTVGKLQIQVLETQMQLSRFLDQFGMMGREKRGLEPSADGVECGSDAKRQKAPTLESVIVEALKVDSLQKLCSSLEPVLHRVVSVEVERALAKLGPARLGTSSSTKRIEGPDGRNLQLHFRSRLSLPLFTGGKVEGEQGAAIHAVLLDANTGCVVTSGPESSAKLDVVVLEGDFNEDDWTDEDFESHVVKEREGKRPLLTGDLQVSLKEGVGTLGELTFTDNSSWIRSRKFRLGLKIASGFCEGIRIRKAKTGPFAVKDHRSELNKKHYPPALKDAVWRLEKIGKDGSFHKRLKKAGIYTVEDFLRLVVRDSQKLRNILGGMSNRMWESLVEHAKTCVLSGKYYVYYSDDTRNFGAIFNSIYEFVGLIAGGQYYPAESLSESQKVFVDTLVKKAYDDWMNVIEYDGEALLNFMQSKQTTTSWNEVPSAQANYSASYDQQQVSQASLSVSVPPDQSLIDTGVTMGGGVISSSYGGNQSAQYFTQTEHVAPNAQLQHKSSTYNLQNQFMDSSQQAQITRNDSTGLVLAPSQQPNLDFQSMSQASQPSNLDSYASLTSLVDDFFSVEEIHITPQLNEGDWTTHQRDSRVDDVYSVEEIHVTPQLNEVDWTTHQRDSRVDDLYSVGEIHVTPQLNEVDWTTHQRDSRVDDLYSVEEIHITPQLNEVDWTTHQRDSRVDDFFSEEEIRMRSYERLENEDMQHLLRIFSMGGAAKLPDVYRNHISGNHISGKVVVGWIKIKAAMRWGMFIRKKAAERRAQLVELDE